MTLPFYPTGVAVRGEVVVFVTGDDLWAWSLHGSAAPVKLTCGVGDCATPKISPDGELVAFVTNVSGQSEVYVMPVLGGRARRLTYSGAFAVSCWSGPRTVVFETDGRGCPLRHSFYEVDAAGGTATPLHGDGDVLQIERGCTLLARNARDPATQHWAGYRGGARGQIWWKREGCFRRVDVGAASPGDPCLLGDRVAYAVEGPGGGWAVWSVDPATGDRRPETTPQPHGWAVRHLCSDGGRVVFVSGGSLWTADRSEGGDAVAASRVESPPLAGHLCLTHAPQTASGALECLESIVLHPSARALTVLCRGQAFELDNLRQGPSKRLLLPSERPATQTLFVTYLSSGRVLCVNDSGDGIHLDVFPAAMPDTTGGEPVRLRLSGAALGEVEEIAARPEGEAILLANHKLELIGVRISNSTARAAVVDTGTSGPRGVSDIAWSPDGRWCAYCRCVSENVTHIRMCRWGEAPFDVTPPAFLDSSPSFDLEGRYLYFLSRRTFAPEEDQVAEAYNFSAAAKPYAVLLQKAAPHPFRPKALKPPLDESEDDEDTSSGDDEPAPVEVDRDGIEQRVVQFPVPASRFTCIAAADGGVVWSIGCTRKSGSGPTVGDDEDDEETETVFYYSLRTLKPKTVCSGVEGWNVSADGRYVAAATDEKLAVGAVYTNMENARLWCGGDDDSDDDSDDDDEERPLEVDIDSRITLQWRYHEEWRQIFEAAWRGLRNRHYDPNLGGIDWEAARERFGSLLPSISTRSELTDLLQEMWSSLGVGHTFVSGPDGEVDDVRQGSLLCDVEWSQAGGYRVVDVARGDVWDPSQCGPLAGVGCTLQPGDLITAIDGRPVSQNVPIEALLTGKGDRDVYVTHKTEDEAEPFSTPTSDGPPAPAAGAKRRPKGKKGKGRAETRKKKERRQSVQGAGDRRTQVRAAAPKRCFSVLYRDWVESRLSHVTEQTKSRIGYVHVPDMDRVGYAEFCRYWLSQCEVAQGMIVDLRCNGGGSCSPLVLDKICRPRIGYDVPRPPAAITSWPRHGPRGPVVLIVDEGTASDGEMLAFTFKRRRDAGAVRGSIVGCRTWGGVLSIGVHDIDAIDGGSASVPYEHFFATGGVGYGIENRGVEPDMHVERVPGAEADAQLDAAIAECIRQLSPEETASFYSDHGDGLRQALPAYGSGCHVDELGRQLASSCAVQVHI